MNDWKASNNNLANTRDRSNERSAVSSTGLPSKISRRSEPSPRQNPPRLRTLSYLKRRLQQRIDIDGASPRRYALFAIYIDSFRMIRDSVGKAASVSLLWEAVRRLSHTVEDVDGAVLSRQGPDRFIMVVNDVAAEEDALMFAACLSYLLRLPVRHGSYEICLSASIGVAFGSAGKYCAWDQLMADAGVALNQAKALGKYQYVLFSEHMRVDTANRLRLESDLRMAVKEKQFDLHYQPKIYLESGLLKGFEALIRWRHPERGWVSPMEFIPLAEELELISEIGRWSTVQAIGQLAEWRRTGRVSESATIAINLSTHELRSGDLREFLIRQLAVARLPAECLILEITESALIDGSPTVVALLKDLVAAGIGLDLDDFGTGYSSLSYLHRFPFRSIKIDQSFVARMMDDPQSERLVAAIIGLARSLDMKVVAEGVETAEQADRLLEMGCPVAQGYYFGRPAHPSDLEKSWLSPKRARSEQ